MFRKHRAAVCAAAIILSCAFSLSFAPVRSAAAQFLSIFRVNKVETVKLTPADLSKLQQAMREGGKVTLADLGEVQYTKKSSSGTISAEEAKKSVDFNFRLPAYLPEGFALREIDRTAGGTAGFTLDTKKTNQVLKTLGGSTFLPDALNGNTFTLTLPVVLSAEYSGPGHLTVSQARSPELAAPGDTSVNAIRDALLSLPILPANLKNQLASINDWQHTFLVPDVNGSAREVSVDGSQGVFVSPPSGLEIANQTSALVWQKDGVVYAISGNLPLAQALEIANSLK